jgi:hypothetical protein
VENLLCHLLPSEANNLVLAAAAATAAVLIDTNFVRLWLSTVLPSAKLAQIISFGEIESH